MGLLDFGSDKLKDKIAGSNAEGSEYEDTNKSLLFGGLNSIFSSPLDNILGPNLLGDLFSGLSQRYKKKNEDEMGL